MVFLRYVLLWGGAGMIAAAVAILARDFYLAAKHKQALATAATAPVPDAPEIPVSYTHLTLPTICSV